MKSENNAVIKQNPTQDANQIIDKSRRSFAKAGVIAPVILTLASRPALGAVCTTSGFVSATATTVSGSNNNVSSCGGLSPGYYKQAHIHPWPSAYSAGGFTTGITTDGLGARTNPVGTLMSVGFSYNGFLATSSMYDVLWVNGNQDPYKLGAHLVAALLNAAAGLYTSSNGLTVADLKDMYVQLSLSGGSSGTYSPAPGVTWTAAEVLAFLSQTMS